MSMIELLCRRRFDREGEAFVPGQHEARILDPRPHRDRADLAAVLTYVDDEGYGCDVLCLRYRDERGWQPVKVTRGRPGERSKTSAVGAPALEGRLREVVEAAAQDAEPFPFEEPSEEERSMRKLAHALIDQVEANASTREEPHAG